MASTAQAQTHDDLKSVASPPARERSLNGEASVHDGVDLQLLLHGLQALRVGNFSVRLPRDQIGLGGKIADTFNDIAAANQRMAEQLEQVGQAVGREGRTKQRVKLAHTLGAWGEMEGSLNGLIDDLLWPTMAVTSAIAAVARGDLPETVRLEVDGRPLKGEFLRLADIVNTMIKRLGVFTSEVTRVAREVGTTVELWLPVAGSSTTEQAVSHATPADGQTAASTCRILVVDDDTLVAESTVSMLEHLGHRVIMKSSGALALETLRSEPQIDLVITDQVMPGMTGLELARHLRQIRPELPIILATGYSDPTQRRVDSAITTLDKPYHLEKLAAVIARAMARDVDMPRDETALRA